MYRSENMKTDQVPSVRKDLPDTRSLESPHDVDHGAHSLSMYGAQVDSASLILHEIEKSFSPTFGDLPCPCKSVRSRSLWALTTMIF